MILKQTKTIEELKDYMKEMISQVGKDSSNETQAESPNDSAIAFYNGELNALTFALNLLSMCEDL